MSDLQNIIEEAFERRADITPRNVETHVREAVEECINMLDSGAARVADKSSGDWVVNEWLKKPYSFHFALMIMILLKAASLITTIKWNLNLQITTPRIFVNQVCV